MTLHNQLGVSTGLLFQGQQMVPDRTGAAAGGTTTYTFTATSPGTYLYEAALLPGAQYQSAMGLYGALIVRPTAAGQAYDDASTAFDDEAVLVLSEVDAALNNATNPAAFDMRNYKPRYSLINGKAYPNTDAIATTAGSRVLLRYVNAGAQYHSMAVLGAHQTVIALDGSPLTYSRRYVAETFGPGQTADAIVTTPASTTDRKLAVYDGSLLLHNSNTAGFGGMLTFINATGTGGGTDTTGPVTSGVAFAAGTLTATVDDTATGGSTVTAAEYFLDTVGAPGSGTAMTGTFGAVSVAVSAAVAVPAGSHSLYVRGQDSVGNWGALSAVQVNGGDATGPTTSGITLTPSSTNGSVNVALHATGSDTASGGSNVVAAEYTIDAGVAVPMTVNVAAPTASLDATIAAATVNALAEGSHTVAVRSQDAAGNWGAPVTATLTVDKTGPTAAGVTVAPTPNNGTLPINVGTLAVRVTATLTDPLAGSVQSSIAAAEAFIDTVGANGAGAPMAAVDGSFNGTLETGTVDIPLATIAQLSTGNHSIYVHARDAAGNWGATATGTLLVDKVAPTVSGVAATPNPTLGATSVTLSATASDALSAVTRAEWFTGTDPGAGNATAMTVSGGGPWILSSSAIDVTNWSEGTYTLNVRARDAAGNWSAPVSTTLAVRGPLSFSTFGNTNPPGVTGTADDADIYSWNGTAFSRALDLSAAPYNLPGTANVDGFDRVSPTQFYLSFSNASTSVPGVAGAVQDEDVIFWNGSGWSMYFDGSTHGLATSANLDLDAISVVGGTLYFSTAGNTNPPGVAGAADDADIYSWNGTSYARVWDATASGLAAAANVDGLVRVDATHFYLSFTADGVAVPGVGAVQDEDVVFNNSGTWSVYFDGTAHGLTSGNLDIDAFDIP
jgi:hypothetical protein